MGEATRQTAVEFEPASSSSSPSPLSISVATLALTSSVFDAGMTSGAAGRRVHSPTPRVCPR